MKERWRYCWALDAWLAPEVLQWLNDGAEVTFEIGAFGYLMRGTEPMVVYPLAPPSELRN